MRSPCVVRCSKVWKIRKFAWINSEQQTGSFTFPGTDCIRRRQNITIGKWLIYLSGPALRSRIVGNWLNMILLPLYESRNGIRWNLAICSTRQINRTPFDSQESRYEFLMIYCLPEPSSTPAQSLFYYAFTHPIHPIIPNLHKHIKLYYFFNF